MWTHTAPFRVGDIPTVLSSFILLAMPFAVRLRTLQRAAQAVGSVEELALLLGVSQHQLDRWLAGEETISSDIFLRAVDLIESHEARGESRTGGNDTQHPQG